MRTKIKNNFIFITFSSIFLFSCSQKRNNIDLSNLPVIKPLETLETKKENGDLINSKKNEYIKDLITFKEKEKILSEFKYGKIDPFSESELEIKKLEVNKLFKDLKLTGFLNTKLENYVFVNYLGNEGTISENSIGGVNTNLLPEGAKIINIDPKLMKLTININDESFVFEL